MKITQEGQESHTKIIHRSGGNVPLGSHWRHVVCRGVDWRHRNKLRVSYLLGFFGRGFGCTAELPGAKALIQRRRNWSCQLPEQVKTFNSLFSSVQRASIQQTRYRCHRMTSHPARFESNSILSHGLATHTIPLNQRGPAFLHAGGKTRKTGPADGAATAESQERHRGKWPHRQPQTGAMPQPVTMYIEKWGPHGTFKCCVTLLHL